MLYLIEVTLYTGLMLLVYLLLLRDRPQHRFNRAYLLATIVMPLVLPLLKLPEQLAPQTNINISNILPEAVVGTQQETIAVMPVWLIVVLCVYGLGVVISMTSILFSYLKMKSVIRKSDKEVHEHYTLLKQSGYGPGSWGKYIFLPSAEVDTTVITHEIAHIQLQHSKDLLFLNLMRSLLWPNLFLHFIKNELVLVHEFQADAAVNVEKEAYAQLLLSSVFSTCTLPLSHSFIVHPIKRRIMMLHKNKPVSKLRSIVAVAASLIIMLGVITIQSCQTKKADPKIYDGPDITTLTKMPEPTFDLYKFIGETVKYPEEAKKEGIEGRIAVKFMVDDKGKIKNVTVANKEFDQRLADAAVAVISAMPDWTPGEKDGEKVSVYYTIPIKFVLPKEEDELSEASNKVFNGDAPVSRKVSVREAKAYNPPPPPPPPTNQKEGFRVRMDRNKKSATFDARAVERPSRNVSKNAKEAKMILDNYNKK